MKKRKRKTLKYMRLSLLCFGLHACSFFLEPFAINGENEITAVGYALGVIFWASLLVGTVLFEICRRNLSGDAGYREWKQRKVPGIFGFFRTKAARIVDPILLLATVITIVSNLTGNIPEGLLLVVLAVMVFTFYLHMMVNGRVYRYMTLSERKEKKSENKEN